eukprot:8489392-Alexandrium_andersonii.AAC.1
MRGLACSHTSCFPRLVCWQTVGSLEFGVVVLSTCCACSSDASRSALAVAAYLQGLCWGASRVWGEPVSCSEPEGRPDGGPGQLRVAVPHPP